MKTLLFACESIEKYIGIKLSQQQIQAAKYLIQNKFVNMNTGQGKTLVILAYCIVVSSYEPVHVLTFNDYLIERDFSLFQKVFIPLNISCGYALSTVNIDEMYSEMQKNNVFISSIDTMSFFYLHCFNKRIDMNKLCFSLVMDECDSVIIDKATIPFVVSAQQEENIDKELIKDVYEFATKLPKLYYEYNVYEKSFYAHQSLLQQVKKHFGHISSFVVLLIIDCLKANLLYIVDVDYIISQQCILYIDQITGRVVKGMRFSGYIHMFLEYKENCIIEANTISEDKTFVYEVLSKYSRICGISGTIYKCKDMDLFNSSIKCIKDRIHTKRSLCNIKCDSSNIYTKLKKLLSFLQKMDTSIVIVCGSIEQCSLVYNMLSQIYEDVMCLNAKQSILEKYKISRMGMAHVITVTNNYFSRGIHVSTECLEGISIIILQPSDTERIDRQIIGRCAREMKKGSVYYFFYENYLLKKVNINISHYSSSEKIAKLQNFLDIQMLQQRREYYGRSLYMSFFREIFIKNNFVWRIWRKFLIYMNKLDEDTTNILFHSSFKRDEKFLLLISRLKNAKR